MKKTAKIFGGLGIVAAIGAAVIPFGASAVTYDPTPYGDTASADVTVELTVVGETPAATIQSPYDGQSIIGLTVPVKTIYSDASQLIYTLTYIASDGTKTNYTLPKVPTASSGTASGTNSFTLDVSKYGGKYGDYILSVRADGAGSTTDSVSFTLLSFDFVVKGTEENTNNPIITIENSPGIYKALVQMFDSDGNAIFDEPYEVILNEGTTTDATLPLAKYGVPSGTYTIVATPYDEDGNIIGLNRSRTITYETPEAPEVPDTGSILGGLGLSKSDLISTGLALLCVCAFFGVMIIVRKNKNHKKTRR